SPCYSSSTYTAPSNSKTGSHRSGNIIEDVLQSFVADTEPEQQLSYEDFDQIEKLDLEEMDLKWQMAMLSVRSNGVIASKEFGMIAGCDAEDAIEEGAAKIYNLITGANTKEVSTAGDAGEFALKGVTSKVLEWIFKKRTKNEAKTTKPDSEWKSKEKTKSKSKPKPEKSTQVNPDKSKSQHVKKNKFKG
ncbi:hypothetical protein Tco_0053133, partial [Tanacetum coccineum]